MKNRDFKGIWIPKEIWLNNELKLIEKIFLVEIDSLDNELCCYASNKYFSEFFGITKGRCSQVINALEKKGLISIEFERDGKIIIARKIRVVNKLNRVYNKIDKGIKKTKGGCLENDKVNNTILNNTVNNKNRFKKPKIEDIKDYCLERKNNIDPQRFYDYYESKGWIIGKSSKMKDWKAAIRTWENRNKQNTGMSKMHKHLSSHMKAQEILKNSRK